jgi:hypothetical protein
MTCGSVVVNAVIREEITHEQVKLCLTVITLPVSCLPSCHFYYSNALILWSVSNLPAQFSLNHKKMN